jgi:hypothetical protein
MAAELADLLACSDEHEVGRRVQRDLADDACVCSLSAVCCREAQHAHSP